MSDPDIFISVFNIEQQAQFSDNLHHAAVLEVEECCYPLGG